MRRSLPIVAGAAVALAVPIALVTMAAAPPGSGAVRTIEIGVHHSRFSTDRIAVRAGETIRFVVHNDDPILHELIVGPPEVHARHEAGTEASHPPRPGEVTIQPDSTATTDYTFTTPGEVEYACHLPGHRAYGMTGQVVVS